MAAVEQAWLTELSEWLRIPSVSADVTHRDDVRASAQWLADFIRRAGGGAELVEWGERPLIVGELAADTGADAPTVLVYGHVDVQPPAPLDLWESPPFEPQVRDGWLYARGAADDKGNLYLLAKAAAQLKAEGTLPVNIRFACDAEEEVGGHSIVDFIRGDDGRADACIIFDGPMPRRGQPAFCIATRGMCYFHVRVTTGRRDLHSGLFGGAALNAMHALVQTVSGVVARDGRLPDALRAGIVAPTEQELADWALLTPGVEELASQGARPADARAADEFYVRTFAEPSLDVNGIEGGSPHLIKTVLPISADANLSIRLAPGQSVAEIQPEVERLLRESAPDGADVEVTRLNSAEPGIVAPDSKAIQLGLGAFEKVLGVRPLLIRSGGTLPVVAALAERGVPTILSGFDLPEGNVHSPNERLLLEHVPLGMAAARETFVALANL